MLRPIPDKAYWIQFAQTKKCYILLWVLKAQILRIKRLRRYHGIYYMHINIEDVIQYQVSIQ